MLGLPVEDPDVDTELPVGADEILLPPIEEDIVDELCELPLLTEVVPSVDGPETVAELC